MACALQAVPLFAVSKLERQLCSNARPCQRKVAHLLQREVANMRVAARGGNAHAVDEHGARLQLPVTRHDRASHFLMSRTSMSTQRAYHADKRQEPANHSALVLMHTVGACDDSGRVGYAHVCSIRWPASRVALVRRASEALTGRAEVPVPPPEEAPPPTAVQQVWDKVLTMLDP